MERRILLAFLVVVTLITLAIPLANGREKGLYSLGGRLSRLARQAPPPSEKMADGINKAVDKVQKGLGKHNIENKVNSRIDKVSNAVNQVAGTLKNMVSGSKTAIGKMAIGDTIKGAANTFSQGMATLDLKKNFKDMGKAMKGAFSPSDDKKSKSSS